MDAGFIKAGFKCLKAFDIDKAAVDVHNRNLGNTAVISDLRFVQKSDLISNGAPDVVIAGSPCQGFSTAGRREVNDPRNSLLLQAGRLGIEIDPKVFIAENVSGALSGEHQRYWNQLTDMLQAAGYSTKTLKLNAIDLGLAQRRARVIMIAWKGLAEPAFSSQALTRKTLVEALSGVEGLPQHEVSMLERNSKHHLISKRIKRGQKLCNVRGGDTAVHTWDIPEVFGSTNADERLLLTMTMRLRRIERVRDTGDADPVALTSLKREFGKNAGAVAKALIRKGYMRNVDGGLDLSNTFNGKYRRLDWNSVSLTVDTRFGDPRYFLHPDAHRSFTVREAARIQGFSDKFLFPGRPIDSYRMIGNAVPPPMAEYIANGVFPLLN
jgi:DNA (cytosine-5)-methyltransferase 1